MRLRHAVFIGRIAGIPLFGADLALSGDAALQSFLNLLSALFFERISATREDQNGADHE